MSCARAILRTPVAVALVATLAMLPAVGATEPAQGASQQPSGGSRVADLRRPVPLEDLQALRSFFERVDVSGVADGLARPSAAAPMTMEAVLGLLPGDWEAPFAFVQGAIAHVPYSASVRGARGALESGGGNSIDQALLLRELLERRGVSTRLVNGRLAWADAARLVVGDESPAAPQPGDPWPRWLEDAADHWWVQAQRNDSWVDLDPSFVDLAAGESVGTEPTPHSELPADRTASVRVELFYADLTVGDVMLSPATAVGTTVVLSFRARSVDAVALWEQTEAAVAAQAANLRAFALGLGLLPRPRRPAIPALAEPGAATPTDVAARLPNPPAGSRADRRRRPSAFQRILLDPDAGPWTARLEAGGQVVEAGPFDETGLDFLRVRVTVAAPLAAPQVIDTPWGGGSDGGLSIVIGAGRVSPSRLAEEALPIYSTLNRLARIEQAAREAMRPPIDYREASESLDAIATDVWSSFARQVPGALGWVVLQGLDRVSAFSPGGRVVRQGLRMAAVRWRPPGDERSGSLEIVVRDQITVGQLTGIASAASLRAAHGLLQSAVLSQVLNRLTERAPQTAFDVTLRAIGTGRALVRFADPESLPEEWPATTRAAASNGLRAGYVVLAPREFVDDSPGWWDVGVADGEAVGSVPGPQTPLHGRVEFGVVGRLEGLEALLASLPSLHRASRWLADISSTGPTALASIPSAACSSAAVAARALSSTATAGWPSPDVLAYCGPG